jgi:hypothetical protein
LRGLIELGSQRLGSLIAIQLAPVSKIPVYELGAFHFTHSIPTTDRQSLPLTDKVPMRTLQE